MATTLPYCASTSKTRASISSISIRRSILTRALALQDKYEFQKWALAMIDAQPFKGGKKGGDGGVDGFLYIKPEGKKTEKVIVSGKGGQSLNPAMVKDLIVTVDP